MICVHHDYVIALVYRDAAAEPAAVLRIRVGGFQVARMHHVPTSIQMDCTTTMGRV